MADTWIASAQNSTWKGGAANQLFWSSPGFRRLLPLKWMLLRPLVVRWSGNKSQSMRRQIREKEQKQTDNFAFEPLSEEQSNRVCSKLRDAGELKKILHPRFICTDKNEWREAICIHSDATSGKFSACYSGLSGRNCIHSSTRCAHQFEELSTHFFVRYSCKQRMDIVVGWHQERLSQRQVVCWRRAWTLHCQHPLPSGGWAYSTVCQDITFRKGVFGLAGSPRRWYLRLYRSLTNVGWMRSLMDAA